MENASRALIIAGSVLISLLVIAVAVFMFNQLSDLRQTQEDAQMEDKLQSFYSNLDTYVEDNKRGSDILSLANLIQDFNERRTGQNEKYGNEGYEPITLRVKYNVDTVDWNKTVFFKGHKNGWFESAEELTKAKKAIDDAVDKKGKEKITGVSNYNVQQLASMRYQELMSITKGNDELLTEIQQAAEEYNILVAEQKDVKNTVRFGTPKVTYDNISGRVTMLEYEQK